jgi:hypothetical protein
MVYLWQSYMIKEGRAKEAWEYAAKIAAYAKENYSEYCTVEVLSNISGPAYQVHFLVKFESLAGFEETSANWFADPAVQELNAGGAELWVDSSFVNNLFRIES